MRKEKEQLPLLPLRGLLVFPNMVLHLDVGRERSVKALEEAMVGDNRILLMAQKDAKVDEPAEADLFTVGTVALIKQMIKLPGGTIRVLVEGLTRASIIRYLHTEPFFKVEAELIPEETVKTPEVEALRRSLLYLSLIHIFRPFKNTVVDVISALTAVFFFQLSEFSSRL